VGLDPSPNELSDLARLGGSGSATRSLLGGFVQWPGPGADGEYDGPVEQVAPADHWELCDLVVVIDSGEKEVSSREGHSRAPTSPHYEKRQELLPSRLEEVRAAVLARDMARLGPAIEMEAVDLHLIAMSSSPPIFYWKPGTLEVLSRVRTLREQGVEVWATMDAGPNLHLICEPISEDIVVDALASAGSVQRIIRDRVGTGPALTEDHLF
jgi:diphosphomevalonate decarboxylase